MATSGMQLSDVSSRRSNAACYGEYRWGVEDLQISYWAWHPVPGCSRQPTAWKQKVQFLI